MIRRAVLRRGLGRATRSREPRAALDALLRWAALTWPDDPPRRPADIARRLDDPALLQAIALAERAVWSPDTLWDGALFATAASRAVRRRRAGRSARNPLELPSLYP